MCTLIALHRCVAGAPLVIAANRDEYLDRPCEGPALRGSPPDGIVAPRDLRGGGTWLGLNRNGVFAAVTNRPCQTPDPGRRSRGLLVLDALRGETAAQVAERLEGLEANAYNPFNLLVADGERCALVTYDGSAERIDLGPGAHVIGNADPRVARPEKLAAIDRDAARAAAAGPDGLLDALAVICRGHGGNGTALDAACVHAGRYGTRSSALLKLTDDGGSDVFRYADGAPCRTAYEDFTPLLHELRREPGYAAGETATRSVS